MIGTITFEETGTQREVKDFCERCQASVSQGNHWGGKAELLTIHEAP